MYELLRPCGRDNPDGKQFLEWGPHWGYHLEGNRWVKGQVDGKGQHGGVDIVAPLGTTLRIPGEGKVLQAGWQDEDHSKGYGLRLIIELFEQYPVGDGLYMKPLLTIGHLSELWMPVGSLAKRGTDFGYSGNSGNSSGPHVHLQLELPGPYPRTPIAFKFVDW